MSSIHPEPRQRPRLQPLPGGAPGVKPPTPPTHPPENYQVDGSKAGGLLQEQAVRILELEQQLRAMQEDMRLMKSAMLGRSRGGEETGRGGRETMLGSSRGGEETGGAEEGRRHGAAASLGGSIGRQLNDFEKQDTLR